MRWFYKLPLRFRSLFGKRRVEQELSDELRFHLEKLMEEKVARGTTPPEARYAALRELGGVEQIKEECREARGVTFVEMTIRDVRLGLRMLAKAPGFTAVGVLTLALGVGANAAIFSVIGAILFRGLPTRNADKVVGLSFHQKENSAQFHFSYPDFEDIRKQASCFSEIFAYRIELDGLNEGSRADQIVTSFVTGNYFTALGLNPALGRLILPSEGAVPSADPVLVLGYSFWRDRFGGDPSIIGKQVRVDGYAFTIVGIAPQGFRGLLSLVDIQAYLPINMFFIEGRDRGWADSRTSRSLYLMGRLKPGVGPARAQASLDVIASRMAQQYPKDWGGAGIETYPGEAANSLFEPSRHAYEVEQLAAGLFLALAGLVLVLCCFNVANILLVRATTREHEMTVRAALGASRGQLIRQLLSESVLLALLGGVVGLVLGNAASRALSSIRLGVGIPIRLEFGFDWRVFTFAVTCALLAGIAVGIAPAIRASRAEPADSLHGGGRNLARGRHQLRDALVVGQLACSMVLLIVAGLFIRSLQKVLDVDLGFDPHNVLNISMDPHEVGYGKERGREFYKDLLARVRAVPGVQSASLAFTFPTSEYSEAERVYVEGHLPPPGQAGPTVFDNSVSPGYFETLRIPITKGREFQETDDQLAPRVAVINQTMAKEFWPNQDPVGKRFKLSSNSDAWIQIVGVVRDSKVQELTARTPAYFYLPLDQDYCQLVTLQVRTVGPPKSVTLQIEHEIHALAPGLPVFGVQTMQEALNGPKGLLHYRLGSALATVLGLLGLLLSVVGAYGVVSYSASQRTREIGIRMALGAQPRDIGKTILGEGVKLVGAGVLVGLLAAFAAARTMVGLVFGVSSYDSLTFAAVSFILGVVAFLASYIPARRATQVDPMVALRHE